MASSLFVNTVRVCFESVLAMDNVGMVAMFESLVDTRLKVNGVTVDISEHLFAETFELPVDGLTDLSEIPKDLVFDVRSIVSLSGEPEKFLMMAAITCGVRINQNRLLFNIFKDMVTPGSRQAKGYAIQIRLLLENVPSLELGESSEFPSSKVLTEKTVHRYIVLNDKVGMEVVTAEPRFKKTPTKKAASKKRPATDADAERLVKKKRTTKSKSVSAKETLETLHVEAVPLQMIVPISVAPAEQLPVPKQKYQKRKRRLVLSPDDEIVDIEPVVENVEEQQAETAVGISEAEPAVDNVNVETVVESVDESVSFPAVADVLNEGISTGDEVDIIIEQVIAETAQLETYEGKLCDEPDVSRATVEGQADEKADAVERWFDLPYEVLISGTTEQMVTTASDTDEEFIDDQVFRTGVEKMETEAVEQIADEAMSLEDILMASKPTPTLGYTCWIRTMIRVDGVWVIEPCGDHWVKIPREVVNNEIPRQRSYDDTLPPVSVFFKLKNKQWGDVCLEVALFFSSGKLLPVGSLNFCRTLAVFEPVSVSVSLQSSVTVWGWSQLCTAFIRYSLFSSLSTADIRSFVSTIAFERTVFRDVQIVQSSVSAIPSDSRQTNNALGEVMNKIDHVKRVFLDSIAEHNETFRGLFKRSRQEAQNDNNALSLALKAVRNQNVILSTDLEATRKEVRDIKAALSKDFDDKLADIRNELLEFRVETQGQLASLTDSSMHFVEDDIQLAVDSALDHFISTSSATAVSTSIDALRESFSNFVATQSKDSQQTNNSLGEVMNKIDHVKRVFLDSISVHNETFRGLFKRSRQEAQNDNNALSLALKAVRNQNVILSTDLEATRKEVRDIKAALSKDFDDKLADIRNEILEFRVETQGQLASLSTHLAELIAFLTKGSDDKKGEGSSSRPQPPPDNQSRPSGGNGGSGNRAEEQSRYRGGSQRRGDKSGSSKRRYSSSGGGPFRRYFEDWLG
ncbi:hypothetical protein F511_29119 [Dorcoceras hygrometricum]|uniref:Uncharacterized protein n=1 Tax=Dorcoceras hygrometricum TaxID=472368 RepID=A0A2Z7A6J1_9LAMI|nr:hypothetical protein F511_29119 [Dorcoceras hygrometricum]